LIKYKLLYEYAGKNYINSVTNFDIITKTATVIHTIDNFKIKLDMSYLTNKLLSFSGYCDNFNIELYEYDLVEIPGYLKGIIKKNNGVFVIELIKDNAVFINMHEMYSTEIEDSIKIPSIIKLGTSIDLDILNN
jgi:hypothetical protein